MIQRCSWRYGILLCYYITSLINLHTGLPTSNWRPCTRWYGADDACTPGILLHSSMQHTWHTQSCSLRWCTSEQFHHHREIFCTSGAHADGFNLQRQHSLIHYVKLIHAYGAPNSLCSSITESKHIKAVKELWQCSSHFKALGQMLLTNQHLDKLAAAWANFTDHGMLQGKCLSAVWNQILHMHLSFLSSLLN